MSYDPNQSPPPSYPPPPSYGGGPTTGYGGGQVRQGNGIGVAGFVCGLLGLLLFWTVWIGGPLAIIGIVLGAVGVNRAKGGLAPHRGLAIAGVVCGAIAIVLLVVLLAIGLSIYGSSSNA